MAIIDRIRRRLRLLYLAWTLKPMAGGAPEGDGDGDGGDGDGSGDDGGDGAGDGANGSGDDGSGDGDGDGKNEPDWKRESRKHERDKKNALKRVTDLEAKLADLEGAAKTDTEKAIEAAKKEAGDAARAEAQTEIRSERLDAAFARAAAGKVVDIDAARKLLDVDPDDLFTDDGKVDKEALQSAIADLLESKKYLAADPNRPTGDPDAGKGKGGGKSLADMSVEEHLQRIRRNK